MKYVLLGAVAAAANFFLAAPLEAVPATTVPGDGTYAGAAASERVPFPECPPGTYQGSSGDCVPSPNSSCSSATAICRDGSCSHSEHRGGTCSSHGGVAQWCPCLTSGQSSFGPYADNNAVIAARRLWSL
jgi:hypothetical protein